MVKPSRLKEVAQGAVNSGRASIRVACAAVGISETCYRYTPILDHKNAETADWLIRLTHNQRNWGFGLCFLYLRNVKNFDWNHKRVCHIYRDRERNLRIKPKKRLNREKPEPLIVPERVNQYSLWILCMTSLKMGALIDCSMLSMTTTVKGWPLRWIFPCQLPELLGHWFKSSNGEVNLESYAVTTAPSTSVGGCHLGQKSGGSSFTTYSPANHNKMLILSGTTEPSDMTGWDNNYLSPLMRFSNTQPGGCGYTAICGITPIQKLLMAA